MISTTASRLETIQELEGYVRANTPEFLKPISECWQPSDFLPDLSREDWKSELETFRKGAAPVSDELLVVLIGDMVTEEALPSYQTWLTGLDGMRSEDPANAWGQWIRGWTAEENRHGDLLNRYLYLTGRVDMRAVEVSIQTLIRNGFDPKTDTDPYLGFVYTSFQERATKISHRNVAILAAKAGETKLQEICGLIAGDEARHERAYQAFMQKIFEADPSGAMTAFAKMMKRRITMPASLMNDAQNPELFDQFTTVAQRVGVYTAQDYVDIIRHLVSIWNVEKIAGLKGEAAEAQDYVCELPARFMKAASRLKISEKKNKFAWIHSREA